MLIGCLRDVYELLDSVSRGVWWLLVVMNEQAASALSILQHQRMKRKDCSVIVSLHEILS